MKALFASLLTVLSFSTAMANEGDLVLPGERWLAKFTGYVCADGNTMAAGVPAELAAFNVVFAKASTDYSLDNLLITATFEDAGTTCNYSSFIFADNKNFTAELVESKAYATSGTGSCEKGRAAIDNVLKFNNYKYLHGRAALYVQFADAPALCAGQNTVGLHFQVTGRVQ